MYIVFHLLRSSFGLCLIVGGALIALYLLGYFLLYKKFFHGERTVSVLQGIFILMLFMYLAIVLMATFLSRGAYYNHAVNLSVLRTYRQAWNSFIKRDWSVIILNILMFVPIGFLLPLSFSKCKKSWVTYLIGLILTIAIETGQYISRQGIFEVVDIVHNGAGCVVGYGFWIICNTIYEKITRKENRTYSVRQMLVYQIPFALLIGLFTTIFVSYQMKELGNMTTSYEVTKDMSHIKLSTEVSLSTEHTKANVYQAKKSSKAETLEKANRIFKVHGTSVKEEETKAYDESMVYYSKDGKYTCWVNFMGGTTWFTAFEESGETSDPATYSQKELKEYMKPYGINIPESAAITQEEDGQYTVQVNMAKVKNSYIDGTLTCHINKEGKVESFNDQMIHYKEYKKFAIISEREAYGQIQKGKFNYYAEPKVKEMKVKEVKLVYLMDSKGFYQPAYDFKMKTDKDVRNIYIPAIQ